MKYVVKYLLCNDICEAEFIASSNDEFMGLWCEFNYEYELTDILELKIFEVCFSDDFVWLEITIIPSNGLMYGLCFHSADKKLINDERYTVRSVLLSEIHRKQFQGRNIRSFTRCRYHIIKQSRRYYNFIGGLLCLQ